MKKLKISKKVLNSIFVLVLLYHIVFVKLPFFSNYNIIKYPLVCIVAVILLWNYKKIKNVFDTKLVIYMSVYFCVVMLSCILNRNNYQVTKVVLGGTMYIVIFFELFAVFRILKNENMFNLVIETFFRLTMFYVIVSDFFIFVKKDLFFGNGEYYFAGNKFSIVYIHLYLLTFYFLKQKYQLKDTKIYLQISVILLLLCIISLKIECMTGIVSALIFMCFMNIPFNITNNNISVLITLIASCSFSFIYDQIIAMPIIQQIIVNVLHRSLTLTGRTIIYENIPVLLENKWLLGYGYGGSYETWMKYFNYPNSQNGLIDLIVNQGVIAAIIFILIVLHTIRLNKKYDIMSKNYSIIIMLFTLIILSSVEITLELPFVAFVAILYSSIEKNKIGGKNENINIINAESK